MIKSALRYPGGKSKAIKLILPMIPRDFKEFREPFVGGGSVFMAVKQIINNGAIYKINDKNEDLYCFWKELQNNPINLYNAILQIKRNYSNGRLLYEDFRKIKKYSDFEKAIRFFVLNRITFSGTVDNGGYSKQAFHKRFTDSSIKKLLDMSQIVTDVEITNDDYEVLVNKEGKDVFIYLDPPYLSTEKSKLYGKKGDLHSNFDHVRFSEVMKNCKHKWLITYDDSPEIRKLFNFAKIIPFTLQYSINNTQKWH